MASFNSMASKESVTCNRFRGYCKSIFLGGGILICTIFQLSFSDIVPLILSLLLLFYYFFQNIKTLIAFLFFLSYKYFINSLFKNRIFRIPLSLQYKLGFFIKRWFNFNRKLIVIIRMLIEIIFNLRNE